MNGVGGISSWDSCSFSGGVSLSSEESCSSFEGAGSPVWVSGVLFVTLWPLNAGEGKGVLCGGGRRGQIGAGRPGPSG